MHPWPPEDCPDEPVADRATFDAILDTIVTECKPRLFAITQEFGDRMDGRIACWGLQFPEHVRLVFDIVDARKVPIRLPTRGHALRMFAKPGAPGVPDVRARLTWLDQG